MNPSPQHILISWISSIKGGEVTKLLDDELILSCKTTQLSFRMKGLPFLSTLSVQSLHHGCDENLVLKTFNVLASRIYTFKKNPQENVFPGATPGDLSKLCDFLCALYSESIVSCCPDENFITSLHHIIDYFLKERRYDSALKLKEYVEVLGYGKISTTKSEKTSSVLNNLYLMFWNSSIECDNNNGDSNQVLSLRLAAIYLLSSVGQAKLSIVADRAIVASRQYVVKNKDNLSTEATFKLCNNILEVVTPLVYTTLKLTHGKDSQGSTDEFTDWSVVCFKPFCEILIEVMRVHNLIGMGSDGVTLCVKYSKMLDDGENYGRVFCSFLYVLCDIFSQVASNNLDVEFTKKEFRAIYCKLGDIQSLSEKNSKFESEMTYCGITFKSVSFVHASEFICRAIVDLWGKQNEDNYLNLSPKERSSFLLFLKLGANLSLVSDLDISYSVKFMSYYMKVIVQLLSIDLKDVHISEINQYVVEAKESLLYCVKVEEKAKPNQSHNLKIAVYILFNTIPVAIEIFCKKKWVEICEIFVLEYIKLVTKWEKCPEFSSLKSDLWWAYNVLCRCCQDQKKFRKALVPLARALHEKISVERSSIFNEWVRVKVKAQSAENADELQLSTVYHILKENVEDKDWNYSVEDIDELLRLEMYTYTSKEVCLNVALKDVCYTILEISSNTILKAEAQLCLIELTCTHTLAEEVTAESEIGAGDGELKDVGHLKAALSTCQELASGLQKETESENTLAPLEVAAIFCLLAQTYYWMYLCLSSIKAKKAQKDIGSQNAIPLKASKKDNNEGQEEAVGDGATSCDVVPSYLRLRCSKQKQLLGASLNVAVFFWEYAVKKGLKYSDCEKFNVAVILKSIETSAHIYELYDDLWHSTKAWCLLCKYADVFKKDETYLLGISNLMRNGAVSISKKYLCKVDEIAAKLKEDSLVLLSYWLGRSWQHLYSSEHSDGLAYLGKVLKGCNPVVGRFHSILYAQARYLLAHYCLQSPGDFASIVKGEDSVFVGCSPRDSAASGLAILIRLLGDWKDSGPLCNYFFAQSLLLDISVWIGELYLGLYNPRDAYAFLMQQFLVAQKLLLPNRTVHFLTVLSLVDIMCHNVLDCEVKLIGMERIIDLEKDSGKETVGDMQNFVQGLERKETIKRKEPELTVDSKVILHCSKSGGMSGSIKMEGNTNCTSPEIISHNYKFTQVSKCNIDCLCEWCLNAGFQKAFLGFKLVKASMLTKTLGGNLSALKDLFDKMNMLINSVLNHHENMLFRMRKFYDSLLPFELGGSAFEISDLSKVEVSRLKVFQIRFLFSMVDIYLKEWENSGGTRNDLLTESESLIRVVEEETKKVKYLSGIHFINARVTMQKLIVGMARNSLSVKENALLTEYKELCQSEDKCARTEVCETPPTGKVSAPHTRKAKELVEDEENGDYGPIPSLPRRRLPRQNLSAMLKEEEKLSKLRKPVNDKATGVKMKEVVNSNSDKKLNSGNNAKRRPQGIQKPKK